MKKTLLFFTILFLVQFKILAQQSTANCQDALFAIEAYLENANSENKAAKKIFNQIKNCADNGDVQAAFTLGVLY